MLLYWLKCQKCKPNYRDRKMIYHSDFFEKSYCYPNLDSCLFFHPESKQTTIATDMQHHWWKILHCHISIFRWAWFINLIVYRSTRLYEELQYGKTSTPGSPIFLLNLGAWLVSWIFGGLKEISIHQQKFFVSTLIFAS